MLTGFQVQNFKVFEDTKSIELGPLTLLSGINSAGKSSILQALLLLKQTLESGREHLTPVGLLLEQALGEEFTDFVFMRPNPSDAALTYKLTFTYMPEEELLFRHLNTLVFEKTQDMAEALTATVEITFVQGKFGLRSKEQVRVRTLETIVSLPQRDLIGLRVSHQAASDSYHAEFIKDKTDGMLQSLAVKQLQVDLTKDFLPQSLGVDRWAQQDPLRDIPQSFVEFWKELFRLARFDLSDNIRYLSSFREPPNPAYSGSFTADWLDPRGDNFPQILWQYRDRPVYFEYPGFPYPDRNRPYEMPLYETVTWILRKVLGLEQSVSVQPEGLRQDILVVQVETLGKESIQVTLANVGLGYNQILPVIVQGLLTPPGGLIIFEQPEIHLHPNVQAKLVQFFVGLAKAGRQVLVETHSSHMIEHLCLEIVKDDTNWLAQNTQTLFIHAPDATHNGARIEEIDITPYGEILNWPPSFLPDVAALDEEIIRAGFAKRQKEQEPPA